MFEPPVQNQPLSQGLSELLEASGHQFPPVQSRQSAGDVDLEFGLNLPGEEVDTISPT